MGLVQSWEDIQRGDLELAYPGWDIWYIRNPVAKQTTWCARPAGAPAAIFHAWSPGELAVKIDRALAS